jgi:hypothetical protein
MARVLSAFPSPRPTRRGGASESTGTIGSRIAIREYQAASLLRHLRWHPVCSRQQAETLSTSVFQSGEEIDRMETVQSKPLSVIFCRLFWLLLGPAGLLLTGVAIVQSGAGWFTGKDLIFGLVVLLMIVCRWVDFLKGNGDNALGDPVSKRYMLGYTVIGLTAGAAIWAGANVLGNYL